MTATLLLTLLFACGGEAPAPVEPAPAAAPTPPPAPATPDPMDTRPTTGRVFFVQPQDGAKVKSPVKIEFGVEGMEIKPAGEIVEGTGHHHLIIGPAGVPVGTAVPADEKHIHFGKGQTNAEIELPQGEHKLTMQFADGNHVSYGDPMAATITITVE